MRRLNPTPCLWLCCTKHSWHVSADVLGFGGLAGYSEMVCPMVLNSDYTLESLHRALKKKKEQREQKLKPGHRQASDSTLPGNSWTRVLFKSFQMFLMGSHGWEPLMRPNSSFYRGEIWCLQWRSDVNRRSREQLVAELRLAPVS